MTQEEYFHLLETGTQEEIWRAIETIDFGSETVDPSFAQGQFVLWHGYVVQIESVFNHVVSGMPYYRIIDPSGQFRHIGSEIVEEDQLEVIPGTQG